ncbi:MULTISPECIES: hypothetical protein [Streptomyces]|uniref:hypothetical protein n=1 Tax=Streptomyces TaxID=1883 RepID=UPI00069A4154|nr:hypothetical protein [Streptomyces sp. SID7805]
MGIESDQLVFDYLSRVGDLAQQRGLPSGARMRLVATLRAEIDAQQADSVSGVKRVLSRLGTPEAVVTAAGSGDGDAGGSGDGEGGGRAPAGPVTPADGHTAPDDDGAPAAPPTTPSRFFPRPAEPPAPRPSTRDKLGGLARRSGLTGRIPAPRDEATEPPAGRPSFLKKVIRPERPAPPAPRTASPPHLAGPDELGDADESPDWWSVQADPYGPGETVPGFVGGIEIEEMREGLTGDRPLSLRKDGDGDGKDAGGDEHAEHAEAERDPDAEDAEDAEGEADGTRPPLPGLLRRALARRRGAAAGAEEADEAADAGADEAAEADGSLIARLRLSPVLTLAALLLVAGAVLGSWLALVGGWALAYVSRRLTRIEAKFAALGVPGIAVGGLMVWIWGRFDGRWGEPITQARLGQELFDGLPVMARVAAVASAAFLVWRMRRA